MTSDGTQYILVTGGTGFIGSHTVLELVKNNYRVVVIDNLCNSSTEPLDRVKTLAGLSKPVPFHKVDLLDIDGLRHIFRSYSFSHVIHFAALKAVAESVENPLLYYRNNITGTLNLLDVMVEFGVTNIVFSSSATVYKYDPQGRPLQEDFALGCTNPYGRTKFFMECIIEDVVTSQKLRGNHHWNAIMLRYFNPTGAHPSGAMGEDPHQQIPNNLMPYVSQVAVGRRDKVRIFGNDYPTHDGTGVRDYIHVMDLAEGHVAALRKLSSGDCGFQVYNLGTGVGYSVLDMIRAMSTASGRSIPYVFDNRRPGDLPTVVCDTTKSELELNFKAKRSVKDMCADLWRWQSMHVNGYK